MRARFLLLLVVVLLAVGFVALNLPEFARTTSLNLGLATVEASVGWVMLAFVGLVLLASMLTGAVAETRNLMDARTQSRELERQRELADRAEASRFTELRTYLDTHLKELRQRDAIAASELEKSRLESQRELRTQLDAMNRVLATRLGELERRIDGRAGVMPPSSAAAANVERDPVVPVVDRPLGEREAPPLDGPLEDRPLGERPQTLGDRMRAAMRR